MSVSECLSVLTQCVFLGFPRCCCQGDASEWETGGGREDPEPDPVLFTTAVPTEQRPAEGAGGESGSLVLTYIHLYTYCTCT